MVKVGTSGTSELFDEGTRQIPLEPVRKGKNNEAMMINKITPMNRQPRWTVAGKRGFDIVSCVVRAPLNI